MVSMSALSRALALSLLLPALAGGLGVAREAGAQSLFSAELHVNDSAITRYEINQRAAFLEYIGAGGEDPRARARDRLIEERLMMQEARRFNVRLSADAINAAAVEFAARAEKTPDEMIRELAAAGVARETFDEFIRVGAVWRELVRGRLAADIRVTEADVDRALLVEAQQPVREVQISELFLPTDPQFAFVVRQVLPAIPEITSIEAFSAAARQYSALPSAANGGRIDRWIPLESMPETLSVPFATAAPGAIVGPIDVPGAYAFFQLRERREVRNIAPGQVELDYRRALLPGGRSDATAAQVAQIRAGVDSCADFGAVVSRTVPGVSAESTAMVTQRAPALPAALRTELARMNPGDISASLVQDGALVVVMLCNRRVVPDPVLSRDEVRLLLQNRALEQAALVYLQTLRNSAEIR